MNSSSIKNIVSEINNENNIINNNYNNNYSNNPFPTFGTGNNNIIAPQYNPNIIQRNPFQQNQIYNRLNEFNNSTNNYNNNLFSSSYNNYGRINNNNVINNNNFSNTYNVDNFFNKELEHIQKVNNKINNLKIEKLNKIQEECTFEPKINTNYKYVKATPIQSALPKKI